MTAVVAVAAGLRAVHLIALMLWADSVAADGLLEIVVAKVRPRPR